MNDDLERTAFEAEGIVPVQMSWGARCDGNTSSAHALMLAILEDAMLCVERGRARHHARTRKQAVEAETWIRSDCRQWLFSFATICDVLGFDADALRARLLSQAGRPASGGPALAGPTGRHPEAPRWPLDERRAAVTTAVT